MVCKKNALILITIFMIQNCLASEKNTPQNIIMSTTIKSPDGRTTTTTVIGRDSKISSLSIGVGNMTFDKDGKMVPQNGVFVDGKRIDKK